ncbi:XRN2 [Lepeophtheirus salmonis]|uniref:5'-3' exoribonuclease n=1 Tax=Lepeophtheirus salmonis TaxID=72036 RepID=A0A7R8H5C3_LEPSM|nr:XRN2 [Lepeophtheirus salmonis]CAF2874049.1 XRN2 [Lepeophtheirus salmonis]
MEFIQLSTKEVYDLINSKVQLLPRDGSSGIFFRWLSKKYPSVIIECLEQKNSLGIPVDSTEPNPNGVEFDNLYLDMNGIIHPCTHPEDKPAPQTEDKMMNPRKKVLTIARLKEELSDKGLHLPAEKKDKIHFDSNCITPGTPFMDRLSKCLQYYIYQRLNTDNAWKGIKVFLSDANVPGEGEHKIMDFIRRQRAQPNHDANTQHVLCGADADLIMLGLATHEPHFTIIREEFKPNRPRPCELCRQMGHDMTDCVGFADKPKETDSDPVFGEETKYIFVRLSVLREYLRKDLDMPNLPFPYDFEKAIDDWIFILEIREGAIDRLVRLYKNAVYNTGGFLTDSGIVNPNRVQLIMKELGQMEDSIFQERQRRELQFRARNKANKQSLESSRAPAWIPKGQFKPQALGGKRNVDSIKNCKEEAYNMRVEGLKEGKRSLDNDSDDDEPPDEVRLYEDGFKDRYYESKFGVLPQDGDFRYRVAAEYTRGLCWVLRYYYQGCASWKWYFPYHYAPFASDFKDVDQSDIIFEKGTQPFKPMEQLMSVFPAASKSHGVALLPFVDENRLKRALEPVYELLSEEEVRRNQRGDDLLFIRNGHPGYDKLKSIYSENGEYNKVFKMDAQLFEGVSGTILFSDCNIVQEGSVRSPVSELADWHDNKAICVRYRDPEYDEGYIFPAKRLKNAKDPPCILKPEDLNPRNNREWRPNFGFRGGRGRGRGGENQASLDSAGHRMLNHNLNRGTNIPPPSNFGWNSNDSPSSNKGGRRNWGSGRGDYGGNNRNSNRREDNRAAGWNEHHKNPESYQRRGHQNNQGEEEAVAVTLFWLLWSRSRWQ